VDGSLFDRWMETLGRGVSRRAATRTLGGVLAAGLTRPGSGWPDDVRAICLPGEPCQCRKTGKTCTSDAKCCSKLCRRGKCVCRAIGGTCQKPAICCIGGTCQRGRCQPKTNYVFDQQWGGLGADKGQFNIPVRVALDASGRVYVTDHDNHRIQVFKPK
jgi:hypothetical protein